MASEPNENEVSGAPRDAASVVLLREARNGLEAFLLKRTGSKTIIGDAYVFPGGKLDPEDAESQAFAALDLPGDPALMLGEPELGSIQAGALFVAACRETFEETGVRVQGNRLLPLSRWITPKTPAMMRRRFDTRFFVALMPDEQHAVHDGEEAKDSAWYSPREALRDYSDGKINLAPPQLMTLAGVSMYDSFSALAVALRDKTPPLIEPVSYRDGEARVIVYPGHPRHPVSTRAMAGPSSLVWRDNRFEPAAGFEGFFTDS